MQEKNLIPFLQGYPQPINCILKLKSLLTSQIHPIPSYSQTNREHPPCLPSLMVSSLLLPDFPLALVHTTFIRSPTPQMVFSTHAAVLCSPRGAPVAALALQVSSNVLPPTSPGSSTWENCSVSPCTTRLLISEYYL